MPVSINQALILWEATTYQEEEHNLSIIAQTQSFFNISIMCLSRNNPINNFINQLKYVLNIVLTVHHKLKIVKQRINYMNYKLNQMEQIMNQGTYKPKGQFINQIR